MVVICGLLSDMKKSFKEIVVALRKASYTDAQLARLCGCSRQYIGNIGKGNAKMIGFTIGRKLEKLYEALQ